MKNIAAAAVIFIVLTINGCSTHHDQKTIVIGGKTYTCIMQRDNGENEQKCYPVQNEEARKTLLQKMVAERR
jgi:hypothetical protein